MSVKNTVVLSEGKRNLLTQGLPAGPDQNDIAKLFIHVANSSMSGLSDAVIHDVILKTPEAEGLQPTIAVYYSRHSSSNNLSSMSCDFVEAYQKADDLSGFTPTELTGMLSQLYEVIQNKKVEVYDIVLNQDVTGRRVTIYFTPIDGL